MPPVRQGPYISTAVGLIRRHQPPDGTSTRRYRCDARAQLLCADCKNSSRHQKSTRIGMETSVLSDQTAQRHIRERANAVPCKLRHCKDRVFRRTSNARFRIELDCGPRIARSLRDPSHKWSLFFECIDFIDNDTIEQPKIGHTHPQIDTAEESKQTIELLP